MSDIDHRSRESLEAPATPRSGTDPVIELYKRHVDRSLLRENLKLTVEQRLRNLQALQQFATDVQAAGRRTAHD